MDPTRHMLGGEDCSGGASFLDGDLEISGRILFFFQWTNVLSEWNAWYLCLVWLLFPPKASDLSFHLGAYNVSSACLQLRQPGPR